MNRNVRIIGVMVALVVGAVTGCGHEGVSPHGERPTLLFQEAFTGPFPGTHWTFDYGTAAEHGRIDRTMGNPAPSLALISTPQMPYPTIRTSVGPFRTTGGLSIAVDIALPSLTVGQSGVAIMHIRDQHNAHLGASVVVNAPTQRVTYSIRLPWDMPYGEGSERPDSKTSSIPSDTGFHTYRFTVDESGMATWSRDGVLQYTRGFLDADLILLCWSHYATASYRFDNIRVTRP